MTKQSLTFILTVLISVISGCTTTQTTDNKNSFFTWAASISSHVWRSTGIGGPNRNQLCKGGIETMSRLDQYCSKEAGSETKLTYWN